MPFEKVIPVVDVHVRRLCVQPYPGHPYGCPNYNKKLNCPPKAKILYDILDKDKIIFAVWNVFDLKNHVEHLKKKHPNWSWRQLVCCYYWQNTARKKLAEECRKLKYAVKSTLITVNCPEGCGVNVTATMKLLGIHLEWPPKTVTYQVALMGRINHVAIH